MSAASKYSFMKGPALCIAMLLGALVGLRAQPCSVSFSYTSGQNGAVTFTAFSSPSVGTYTYSWNFTTTSGTVVVGSPQSTYSYVPGVYVVTLSASNGSCSTTFTGQIVVPTCVLNFSATPTSFSTVCNGSATVSVPGVCSPVSYVWSNSVTGATQGSLCPGNYTVTATTANTACCPSMSAIVTVPANTVCSLQASFGYSVSNVTVNFFSTSTGTLPTSTYTWDYGDGSTGSGITSSHTYTSFGVQNTILYVDNVGQPGCSDSSFIVPITVTPCALSAVINYSQVGNGVIKFSSTLSGVTGSTQFAWLFGDGQGSNQDTVTHYYSAPGPYTVTLTLTNSPTRTFVTTLVIPVSYSCVINAAFNHTVGANGVVRFASSSTGTTSLTKYLWDFGDGWGDIAPAPTHTYANAGTHYVTLALRDSSINCRDSVIQSINITGIPCSASAQFSIVPTNTAQYWQAVPDYPFNVSNAVWSWGDGQSSAGLYTSHVYSVAGNYNICLSVTVSCGASASYCSSFLFNKPAGSPPAGGSYSVNVVSPTLKLGLAEAEAILPLQVIPNPCSYRCVVSGLRSSQGHKYRITALTGVVISEWAPLTDSETLDLSSLEPGVYILSNLKPAGQKPLRFVIYPN